VFASDDPFGRTADITQQSIPASGWAAYIFEPRGWEQELGSKNVEFACSHAEVLVAAIAI
jgi:hypothetical protein